MEDYANRSPWMTTLISSLMGPLLTLLLLLILPLLEKEQVLFRFWCCTSNTVFFLGSRGYWNLVLWLELGTKKKIGEWRTPIRFNHSHTVLAKDEQITNLAQDLLECWTNNKLHKRPPLSKDTYLRLEQGQPYLAAKQGIYELAIETKKEKIARPESRRKQGSGLCKSDI